MQINFFTDSLGVNRAGFNGLTNPHSMSVLPPLFTSMQPLLFEGIAVADFTANASSYPIDSGVSGRVPVLPGIGRDATAGNYLLPSGAVVEVLVNNTDTGEVGRCCASCSSERACYGRLRTHSLVKLPLNW